jgi:2-alkenal reductase
VEPGSTGSAFIWDADHIVTNFHVVADMVQPAATFVLEDEDGKEMRVSHKLVLVGGDPLSDIAVFQAPTLKGTDAARLVRPLPKGSSAALQPGQDVFALGNPFGLEHSMSRGVISGVARTMPMGLGAGRPMTNVIQTDAAINPGNSGGPLLDSDGKVVGMNTAILSGANSFGGVGLAIPIDLMEDHVGNMISNGYVSRAALGVTFAPDGMSQALGINDGVMVMKVVQGGPASKAGVRAFRKGHLGDVIVNIAGTPVSTSDDVVKVLDELSPGKRIRVQLKRASQDVDSDSYEYLDLSLELVSSGAMNYPMIAM